MCKPKDAANHLARCKAHRLIPNRLELDRDGPLAQLGRIDQKSLRIKIALRALAPQVGKHPRERRPHIAHLREQIKVGSRARA
jgi:hypothetical protein